MPLVGSVLIGEFDGLQIAPVGVIVVKALCFEILEVGGGRDGPIVIDQPSDCGACASPLNLVDIVFQKSRVVFQAATTRAHHGIYDCRAEYVIDETRVSRAKP